MRPFMIPRSLLVALAACLPAGMTYAADSRSPSASVAREFTMLPAATLKAELDAGQAVQVYDANSRETYEKGHVPGATWVDYDTLSASTLPPARDTKLVFYCANEMCMASHFAAKRALALGYDNVKVMPEGIQGWENAGYPVVKGASAN